MVHLILQELAGESLPVMSLSLLSLALLWFIVCATVLIRIDVREHRLPNRWTAGLWLGGVFLLLGATLSAPATSALSDRWQLTLLGSLGYLILMLILHILTRAGVGMGDVKLAAGLGLYGGFLGLEALVVSVVLAFIIGGLHALYLVIFRGAKKTTRIAFGPAMLIGCTLTMLI